MKSVPSIPLKKETVVDPEFAAKWERMRVMYAANNFHAYLVYVSDDGKTTIVMKNDMLKTDLADNFKEFVKKQQIDLTLIVDRDSTEILWACPNNHMKVGDALPTIHELWATLGGLPRYYNAGQGKVVDNHAGGKIVDDPRTTRI